MKKNILSKLSNFLTGVILLFINSCAYFKLKELENYDFTEENIYNLVSEEYKNLAYYEYYEMYDELDANYFALKSLEILNKNINIENPKN